MGFDVPNVLNLFSIKQQFSHNIFFKDTMKSRNHVRATVISTLIIIGLFVFCYYWFIRPIYLNNWDQNKKVSLKKEQTIAFGKYANQNKVFGIELEMTGNSDSNLDILISDEDGNRHAASVKGKNLDFVYKNSWTGDSIFIQMIPRGASGGNVEINCRFLAVD